MAKRKKEGSIKLLNSAITPTPGLVYVHDELDEVGFFNILHSARDAGTEIQSYIGYPQNLEYIEEVHGLRFEMNKAQTPCEPGDMLMIMKLNYRPSAKDKGKPIQFLREHLEFRITHVFSKNVLRHTPS